jgi:hypothetical protein
MTISYKTNRRSLDDIRAVRNASLSRKQLRGFDCAWRSPLPLKASAERRRQTITSS